MAVPRRTMRPRPAVARIGPVSSSGTNNTIRATRMIAPVSRSFTLSTHDGGKCAKAKRGGRRAGCGLVYPKPPSAGPTVCTEPHTTTRSPGRAAPRAFAAGRHRVGQLEAAGGSARRAASCAALAPRGPGSVHTIQRSMTAASAAAMAAASLSLSTPITANVTPCPPCGRGGSGRCASCAASTRAAGSLCAMSRIHSTSPGTTWKRPGSCTRSSPAAVVRASSAPRRPRSRASAAPAAPRPSTSSAASAVAALRYWMAPASAGGGRSVSVTSSP